MNIYDYIVVSILLTLIMLTTYLIYREIKTIRKIDRLISKGMTLEEFNSLTNKNDME